MSPGPPPSQARVRRASLVLRLGVALQCATLAWLALEHGTPLDTWLFMELGTSEAAALRADRALAAVALAAGGALLVRPFGAAAVAASLAFLVVAVATRVTGGRAFSELAPLAQATRWLAPLALAALWSGLPRGTGPARRRVDAAAWVLRLSVAATFLAHGWQALHFHPAFVDLLIGTARRWAGAAPPESSVHVLLLGIGGVDVTVALVLVLTRWRPGAGWAAAWGLATALSRVVALGPDFAHEALLRAMNGLAPLALWLLWGATAPARSPDEPTP